MWQQRFGGEASVVGRSITLNGAPVTIVGVMPQDFYFPNRTAEFWRPVALNPANASRGAHFLGVVGRLKPGVTIERAGTEMKAISERLAVQYPDNSAGESALVVGLQEQIVGAIRPALLTLFAAVGVVVLIACANVANLLLVRASVREKEIAIRTALGAARSRLAGQMLAESLVLAIAGGSLGVLLGLSRDRADSDAQRRQHSAGRRRRASMARCSRLRRSPRSSPASSLAWCRRGRPRAPA